MLHYQSLSATLNFALRALGFDSISALHGKTGFLVMLFSVRLNPQIQTGKSLGHVHPFSLAAIAIFIILSSKE